MRTERGQISTDSAIANSFAVEARFSGATTRFTNPWPAFVQRQPCKSNCPQLLRTPLQPDSSFMFPKQKGFKTKVLKPFMLGSVQD
jgi:hypothetical protein